MSERHERRRPCGIDANTEQGHVEDDADFDDRNGCRILAAPDISGAGGGAPAIEEKKAAAPIVRKGSVPVNGIDYYYEIRGEGEPLLLLHGGLGQIEMFAPVMPVFTDHRQVIAVDLQGHGRTPLGQRPIELPAIGADLAIW